MGTTSLTDYDGAWKEALEQLFPAFVAFFWPTAATAIDWSRPYEFLDQELHQIAPAAAVGERHVDKLARVWLRSGKEAWVLIHVEIQSQRRRNFAERMYIYNYRIYDRFRQRVASLAVLADRSPTWRPNQFGYTMWDSQVDFRYPVVKLNDYRARWVELEASNNPFATVVMAHLRTQDTRKDSLARHDAKLALIKRLYRLSAARSTWGASRSAGTGAQALALHRLGDAPAAETGPAALAGDQNLDGGKADAVLILFRTHWL